MMCGHIDFRRMDQCIASSLLINGDRSFDACLSSSNGDAIEFAIEMMDKFLSGRSVVQSIGLSFFSFETKGTSSCT